MIVWKTGKVTAVLRTAIGLQEVRVRTASGEVADAIHYTDELPPLREGDEVLLNTTAVELKLGTGGYHFVHAAWNPNDGGDGGEDVVAAAGAPGAACAGHLMKLRYTSLQRAVLAAEEPASPHHELFLRGRLTLGGMPVLIGDVHSVLPVATAWLRHAERHHRAGEKGGGRENSGKRLRIAYVMSDGGALPLALSRHVAALRACGWLTGAITYGHAYGGDVETVNKFTALLAARHVLRADVAIAVMGPGHAGTGTPLGHSGMEAGELVNAAAALGGVPVVIPRLSFADRRERHLGISHHTLESLGTAAFARAVVPLPDGLSGDKRLFLERQLAESGLAGRHDIRWLPAPSPDEIGESLAQYPLPVSTMGRSFRDDPAFFQAVCAAAQLSLRLCRESAEVRT